ncbi:MAG: M18 family aminopeptidase [Desulfobacterales bacterium]|nr:M18 family aminopeptidase [Desulfobacterales bacterium]
MNKIEFNDGLLEYLATSPTPFHAVANLRPLFESQDFEYLDETQPWNIKPGGRYVVTRNGSALIAFILGQRPLHRSGLAMAGAHTDSPCLKVKPSPLLTGPGGVRLGVEVYGSPLLNTWFDRDLSIAGRVSFVQEDAGSQAIQSTTVDLKRPLAVIPNLAIHLDREANKNRSVQNQKELPALISDGAHLSEPLEGLLKKELAEKRIALESAAILEYELQLYDTQPPDYTGHTRELFSSARIDNLLSCYTLAHGLANASAGKSSLIVLNDHEEVGSHTPEGASGNFLSQILERILPDPQERAMALAQSFMISSDNAHALHPAHVEKYDPGHSPLLNNGPVIKYNANRRYATTSETAARFRLLCRSAGVPTQSFVMRSDMPCGSTIGPLVSSLTGVPTVDIGVPMLAMHSIRETAGCEDAFFLYRVMVEYFQ